MLKSHEEAMECLKSELATCKATAKESSATGVPTEAGPSASHVAAVRAAAMECIDAVALQGEIWSFVERGHVDARYCLCMERYQYAEEIMEAT